MLHKHKRKGYHASSPHEYDCIKFADWLSKIKTFIEPTKVVIVFLRLFFVLTLNVLDII